MSLGGRLTLVLPVRGRPEFTERWLRWVSASGLECPVIVADGSGAEDAEKTRRIVAAGQEAGRPWNHRRDASGILERVAASLLDVRTPFAALAANDDFPLADGLSACVSALEADPAAAACGGPAAAVLMPAGEPLWSAAAAARELTSRSPLKRPESAGRVEDLLDSYDPLWYDVQRAPVAADAFARVRRAGVGDLNLAELLHSACVAAAGPVLRCGTPHLARQEDAAGSASGELALRGDLLDEILAEGWGAQFDAFVSAAADAAGGPEPRERVRKAYGRYVRAVLARSHSSGAVRRRAVRALKAALGETVVGAVRRVRASAPSRPRPAALEPVLAFLASGAREIRR